VDFFEVTIAVTSAPDFVFDEQATEHKKDYKEKDKYHDKDSRYDDNKKYGGHDDYGKDRENKYGGHDDYGKDRENKYSKYDRDGHDEKSSVKYIKCNNVNINGKGGHSGGNDNWPRDGGNDNWPRDGGNDNWPRDGGNEWPRGGDNHNVPGFVKQTDKDVVVICIFNNDGKKDNKTAPINECIDCFITTNDGGFLPPGQLEQFEDFLADLPPSVGISNIQELCDAIDAGEVTEAQLERAIEIVFGSGMSGNLPPFAEKLLDCLISFLPPVE
jgi:hypothetical protein